MIPELLNWKHRTDFAYVSTSFLRMHKFWGSLIVKGIAVDAWNSSILWPQSLFCQKFVMQLQ